MKIEKLIEILDKEEAERQRGMVTVSLELIRESNFDLRPFLADAFSKRMSRPLCERSRFSSRRERTASRLVQAHGRNVSPI